MAGLRGGSQPVLEGNLQINGSNRLNISRVTVRSQRTELVIMAQQNESVPQSSRRSVIGLVAAGLAGGSFVKAVFAKLFRSKLIHLGLLLVASVSKAGTDNSDQARAGPAQRGGQLGRWHFTYSHCHRQKLQQEPKEIINVKSLIDKKAWLYVQNDLRLRASHLRYDLNTIISAKPKEEKKSLKELTGKLFETIDNLDYAARSKSSPDAEKYYSETVSSLNNVLAMIG